MADKLFFGDVERQGKKAAAEYMRRRGAHDGKDASPKNLRKETKAAPASGGQVFQGGAKNVTQGGTY